MHEIIKQLVNLGLIRVDKRAKFIYSYQQGKEYDLDKLINGQAYWQHDSIQWGSELTANKIIINNLSALSFLYDGNSYLLNPISKLFLSLIKLQFVLVVRVDESQFVEIRKFKDLDKILQNIKLTQPETIISELEKKNVEINDYFIMDDKTANVLIKLFHIADEDFIFRITDKYHYNEATTELLNTQLQKKQYDIIEYSQGAIEYTKRSSLRMQWDNNNLDAESLQKLLAALTSGIANTSDYNNEHLKSLYISSPSEKIPYCVDLKDFSMVETLVIQGMEEFIHLEALIRLKYLTLDISEIRNENPVDIDFEKHPQLTTLLIDDKDGKSPPIVRLLPYQQTESKTTKSFKTFEYRSIDILVSLDAIGGIHKLNCRSSLAALMSDRQALSESIKKRINQPYYQDITLNPSTLEVLEISNYQSDEKTEIEIDVTGLKNLRELRIRTCCLRNILGLEDCSELELLVIDAENMDAHTLEAIFAKCPKLKNLTVDNYRFDHLIPLPPHLSSLTLTHTKVTNLQLDEYQQLKKLELKSNSRLIELTYPQSLEKLKIDYCKKLKKKINLSGLVSLNISRSNNIELEPAITNLKLEKLIVHLCDGVDPVPIQNQNLLHNLYVCITTKTGVLPIDEQVEPVTLKLEPQRIFGKEEEEEDEEVEEGEELAEAVYEYDTVELLGLFTSLKYISTTQASHEQQETSVLAWQAQANDSQQKETPRKLFDVFYERPENEDETTISSQMGSTYTDPDSVLTTQLVFLDQKELPVNYYRMHVCDTITINQSGDFVFVKCKENDWKPTEALDVFENTLKAKKEISIQSGRGIILAGSTAQDILTEFSEPDHFDIFYSKSRDQYLIKLKKNGPQFYKTVISYAMKPLIKYDVDAVNFDFTIMENHSQMIPALTAALNRCLPHLDSKNLFKIYATSREEIFKEIYRFCRQPFKNEALPWNIENSQDPIKKFIYLLYNPSGSCRHRALIAKILCDYFGISARIILNDCHAFIEVQTADGYFIPMNLGGASCVLHSNPIPKTNDELKAEELEKREREKAKKEPETALDKQAREFVPYFLRRFNWLEKANTFNEFADHAVRLPGNFLLATNSPHEDAELYQSFAQYAKGRDFIYLQSAADIIALMNPIHIDGQSKKPFQRVNGPLAEMIEGGSGIILVNWSNFSPRERAIYKSMLDKPPTLNGKPLRSSIKVVGMLGKRIKVNDVFLSRCIPIDAPIHLIKQSESTTTASTTDKMIESDIQSEVKPEIVNLYHSPDWRMLCISDIELKGKRIFVEKKKLIRAMEKGLPIIIKNPPKDDPDFDIMLQRLNVEGKIMVNGELIKAKTGFSVKVVTEPIVLKPPQGVTITVGETSGENFTNKYYINCSTFSTLFRINAITTNEQVETLETTTGQVEALETTNEQVETLETTTGQVETLDGLLWNLRAGDQLIFTEKLDPAELDRLYSELESKRWDQARREQIHICFADTQKTKHPEESDPQGLPDLAKHIQTNDPHYIKRLYQLKQKIPDENILYTGDENTFSNLITKISLRLDEEGITGSSEESKLWKKLKSGETIIMVGDLSLPEQKSLQTLFVDPPYVLLNGKRENVEGRLIWISKKQQQEIAHLQSEIVCTPSIEDYANLLRQELSNSDNNAEINEALIGKTIKFFKLAKLLKAKGKHPESDQFNYEKFKDIYRLALVNPNHPNPIKPLLTYHYLKGSEAYAYMNVLAKKFFGRGRSPVPREALIKYCVQYYSDSSNISALIWQIINCFSGDYIRENLGEDWDLIAVDGSIPKPNDKLLEDMDQFILKGFCEFIRFLEPISKEREEKQNTRLLKALVDKSLPLIMLLGEAGVGKTYSVRQKAKISKENNDGLIELYESLDQIGEFAKNAKTAEQTRILLLDEGNLEAAGKLEFLRGLNNNPPTLIYSGKTYPLSGQHKVIVTGNPLSYRGREFHDVLWEKAHVIWYDKFSENFVRDFIVKNILKLLILEDKDQEVLVEAAKFIAQYYLTMANHANAAIEMTLRDIENITARIALHKTRISRKSWIECAQLALYDELHGRMVTAADREKFRKDIGLTQLPICDPLLTEGVVITAEKMQVYHLILDDLEIQERMQQTGKNFPFKRGILLEGASGAGKSKMMLTALKQMGYSMDHPDPRKRFYQISAGSENVRDVLLKAYFEGSKVILDELNLDPEIEDLLNQLLDPNNTPLDILKKFLDPKNLPDYASNLSNNNNPKTQTEFMILSTQNPSHYSGCEKLSVALESRFHKIVMEDYAVHELEYIAKVKEHPEPSSFARGFFIAKKENPAEVNMRNYFEALEKPQNNEETQARQDGATKKRKRGGE